jgi:hypothetical protein
VVVRRLKRQAVVLAVKGMQTVLAVAQAVVVAWAERLLLEAQEHLVKVTLGATMPEHLGMGQAAVVVKAHLDQTERHQAVQVLEAPALNGLAGLVCFTLAVVVVADTYLVMLAALVVTAAEEMERFRMPLAALELQTKAAAAVEPALMEPQTVVMAARGL